VRDGRPMAKSKVGVDAYSGEMTTPPLDTFESLSGWSATDPRQSALFSVALSHEVPLMLLKQGRDEQLWSVADTLLLDALDFGFAAFCTYAAPRWKELRSLVDTLLHSVLAARPANSHHLLRLLRDHWFWMWFEVLTTTRVLATSPSKPRRIVYWEEGPLAISSILVPRAKPRPAILIGPSLTVPKDMREGDAEAALSRFCAAIDAAWAIVPNKELPPNIQTRSGGRFPLYNTAFLSRAASSRSRANLDDLEELSKLIDLHVTQITDLCEQTLGLGPYRSIFRASALITGNLNRAVDAVTHDAELVLELPDGHAPSQLIGQHVNISLRYKESDRSQIDLEQVIERQGKLITAAWRGYIHDSNIILSSWLNHSLWEQIAQSAESDNWGDLGRRLTRFLAATFLANECSIYRVDYGQGVPMLFGLGGYSDDEDGGGKIAAIAHYMNKMPTERRHSSICYRALDSNIIEYVAFEPPEKPDEERRLAFPETKRWTLRGRSGVAMPIRVNGAVWGIVELISFNFDQFPFNVRSQLGEFVDTIGNALSFQNVSAMLNYIDKITAAHDTDASDKRDRIVAKFPSFFMSSDVALVRVRGGSADEVETTMIASTGVHASLQPGADTLGVFQTSIEDLVVKGAPVAVVGLLDEPRPQIHATIQTIEKNFVLVALPRGPAKGYPDVLILRFPIPVRPEAGWHHPLQVLGQYLISAIETLEAEINWTRQQRARYGHEMIRNITAIGEVESRIKTYLTPLLQKTEGRSQVLDLALSDLARARRSLRLYAEALTDATLIKNSAEDPRIAAMRSHLRRRKGGASPAIDIRDTFHAATYSRREEAGSFGVRFLPFPNISYPKIQIDDVLLYDVMSTLVDNAIKYSIPNNSVQVTPRYDHKERKFSVAISNLGAELIGDEPDRIFDDRYRGRYAQTRFPSSGRGLGLGYARALMEMVEGDLTYRQRKTSERMAKIAEFTVMWHNFILTFSGRSIKDV
jgi:signal transduction histidine kinase